MSRGLQLIIATPAKLLIDVDDVRSLRAEDDSGAFGVLPGHADLLTVLAAVGRALDQSGRIDALLRVERRRISGRRRQTGRHRVPARGDRRRSCGAKGRDRGAALGRTRRRPQGAGRADAASRARAAPVDAVPSIGRAAARRRRRAVHSRGCAMIAPSDGRHEKMQEAALRAQRRADAASQQREPRSPPGSRADRRARMGDRGAGSYRRRHRPLARPDLRHRRLLHRAAHHARRRGGLMDGVAMDASAMIVALMLGLAAGALRRGASGVAVVERGSPARRAADPWGHGAGVPIRRFGAGAGPHRASWRSAAPRRGVRRPGRARPFTATVREDGLKSPLTLEPLFHIGPAPITEPVVVAWAVMALIGGFAALSTRRLALAPSRTQAAVEILVSTSTTRSVLRCSAIRRRFALSSARSSCSR